MMTVMLNQKSSPRLPVLKRCALPAIQLLPRY